MSKIDYQALREKAEKATSGEWSLEYGESRFDCDDALIHRDVVGYLPICRIEGAHPESGFDEDFQMEQQANAEFIAAANPATVLALLDELEKDNCSNVHYADAAEMEIAALRQRIAELQIARDKCFLSGLKTGWEYGIADDTEGYNREIADAQAVIDRAAGIGVKGE